MLDYSHFAILLLFIGFALLVAEIFIPSGGMILIITVLMFAASAWCAWNAWWDTNPTAFWFYVGSVVFLLPVVIAGTFYIFPRTKFGRRILLEAPELSEVSGYSTERERLTSLMGHTGKTLTQLNPGGLVIVDGERMHCESEGMMLDPGDPIIVVGVKGNRLVVRLASQEEIRDLPTDVDEAHEEHDEPPLDFDISQS